MPDERWVRIVPKCGTGSYDVKIRDGDEWATILWHVNHAQATTGKRILDALICEAQAVAVTARVEWVTGCRATPPTKEPEMDEPKVGRHVGYDVNGWQARLYAGDEPRIRFFSPYEWVEYKGGLSVGDATSLRDALTAAVAEADASRYDWMLDLAEESCNQEAKVAVEEHEKMQPPLPDALPDKTREVARRFLMRLLNRKSGDDLAWVDSSAIALLHRLRPAGQPLTPAPADRQCDESGGRGSPV